MNINEEVDGSILGGTRNWTEIKKKEAREREIRNMCLLGIERSLMTE